MTMQIAVAPSDSFEHWHQVTCRQYSITQCRAISDHAFSASIATRSFGDLVLSEIASTVVGGDRLRVVRSASDARRDGRDDFMFWLCLDGSTRFEQCGRIVELAPGDMMLHDQAYPFILEFGHTSRTTMITIARPLLTLRAPRAELLTARRIAASSPFATFARGLVESCVHSDSALPQHVAGRLANAALDIWSTTLEGTFRMRPANPC